LQRGFEDVEAYEIGLVRRIYVVLLAQVHAAGGQPDTALQMASQGPAAWPMTHVARALALLALGRPPEAEAAAHEGLAIARRIGEQISETAALLLLAEVHGVPGAPPEPSRSHGEAALRIAQSLGLRAYQVHGHRLLGTLLAAAGEHAAARQHLAAALQLYGAMGMTRWTASTTDLLNRLGGAPVPSPVS
jgi:tetratricopeptide (TPR) repeat protein